MSVWTFEHFVLQHTSDAETQKHDTSSSRDGLCKAQHAFEAVSAEFLLSCRSANQIELSPEEEAGLMYLV
jgi:hypothetical protein